jgi:hypothetical protein
VTVSWRSVPFQNLDQLLALKGLISTRFFGPTHDPLDLSTNQALTLLQATLQSHADPHHIVYTGAGYCTEAVSL